MTISLLMCLASATLGASAVEAQDCGSWNQSVLCTVELRASVDRGRSQRFDPGRRQTIAPRQTLELELRGRDQTGRDFLRDRLRLDFDARECRRVLDVSDGGQGVLQITARATTGRCRLDMWVPGNLNFEWRVEFEISATTRAGYSRAEAEWLVRSLYLGILGREVDSASVGATVAELQQDNLEGQVSSMVRSQEFTLGLTGVDAGALLDRFYLGLLGRRVDSGGVRTCLSDVQRGRNEGVILKIIQSSEFERRLASQAR